MDERTMGIFGGIAQGLEKAASNLYDIGVAERKAKREQEIFNLDKKVKNAQIKKMETLYGEDAMAHEKKMWKLEEKKTNVATEQALANIAKTKQENEQSLKGHETAFNILKTTQPELFRAMASGETMDLPEGTEFDLKLGSAGTMKTGGTRTKESYNKAAKQRHYTAWLSGEDIVSKEGTTSAPNTREEAYWGLMQAGEDPEQYSYTHLPSQTELYGEPATGLGRMLPGKTRASAFKREIPEEYTPEQEGLIKTNMGHYGRSRAEVIKALKTKGHL